MSALTPLGKILRQCARGLIRLCYPSIEVTGRERIPATGAVLFVANHPNSMLDPAVIGLVAERPVHFLAKAPLFDIPVFGALMRALGMIPAYRGGDDASQVRRNLDSLSAAAAWLVRGEPVGIFPEGKTHDLTRVEMVRSGAARLALQAVQQGATVTLVPLGLNYERKERFRSAIWVRVGEVLDAASNLSTHAGDDHKAIRALTNEIDRRLKQVAVHLEEEKWAPFLPELEVLLPPPPEFANVPAAPLRQRKRIADAMNHFLGTDRPRAEAMAAGIERHRAALASFGLSISSDVILHHGRRLSFRLGRQAASLALAFVPAVAGAIHHLVPFAVTRLLANLVKHPGRATLAFNRLLIGLPLYALWYAFVGWEFARWFGIWPAMIWTGCMPVAGIVALHFAHEARKTFSLLWHEFRLLVQPRHLNDLRRQQLELRHQLRQLATEYDRVQPRQQTFAGANG